jgi:hypothetical protein
MDSVATPTVVSVAMAIFIIIYISLLIGIYVSQDSGSYTWAYQIASVVGISLCTIPPILGFYAKVSGTPYPFQDYAVQLYLPVFVGFLIMLGTFSQTIDPEYVETFLIILGTVSILFSTCAISFMLLRMKYAGT